MLDQLIAEGRRVPVFSQFVTMMRLIETDVKARGWDYAWLTGETRNREEAISGFQAGQAPLFLISLKAGGVGLTLTAADTVILYDPWWNPAVERQAMDRVHRIGQDRAVFVYRLVAEGSVEQAIAALQARKQALADALFEGSSEGPLALTEADLASLFQPIGARSSRLRVNPAGFRRRPGTGETEPDRKPSRGAQPSPSIQNCVECDMDGRTRLERCASPRDQPAIRTLQTRDNLQRRRSSRGGEGEGKDYRL